MSRIRVDDNQFSNMVILSRLNRRSFLIVFNCHTCPILNKNRYDFSLSVFCCMMKCRFSIFVYCIHITSKLNQSSYNIYFTGISIEDCIMKSCSSVVVCNMDYFWISRSHNCQWSNACIFSSRAGCVMKCCSAKRVFSINLTSCLHKYFKSNLMSIQSSPMKGYS